MALKKQSIRKNISILVNNEKITKEELITLSEEWSEIQESFFKKMVKQGGKFKVNGANFSKTLSLNSFMVFVFFSTKSHLLISITTPFLAF